jgi:hypothetical protein
MTIVHTDSSHMPLVVFLVIVTNAIIISPNCDGPCLLQLQSYIYIYIYIILFVCYDYII